MQRWKRKKLRLSEDKCFKINIDKKNKNCPQVLKVHEKDMKNASEATYLGDVISENGTIDATVLQRTHKQLAVLTK